jgi:hypothetical protein
MGCAKCGGAKGSGKRCCLCGTTSSGPRFPWGTQRVICKKCKDREEKAMKERKFLAERAEILLSGKDYKRKI